MTIAILCSGQGGQHAGMFALTADLPEAAPLFAHAAALLGADPREWVCDADDEALRENFAAQLVCTLQAVAAMTRLDALLPRRRCVAGYSVGELAAWSVAGLVEARDALDLVAARARDGRGERRRCANAVRARARARRRRRIVCRARRRGRDRQPGRRIPARRPALAADARARGAARVTPVCVRVASHTRWLDAAVPRFRAALAGARIARAPAPGTRLLSGIDGAPVLDVAAGADKLARQIAEPLDWAACVAGCVEAGARAFVELGPGRALAEMAAAAFPALPARSLADFRSWDGVRAWLSRVDLDA